MIVVELVYELPVQDERAPYRTWVDFQRRLHVIDKVTGAELLIEWRYIDRSESTIVSTTHLVIVNRHATAFALDDIAGMFALPPGTHRIDVELESMMAEVIVTVISGVAKAPARNLDELLIELADAPNQEVRTILVDTWNDAGEAFAPAFARQLAGGPVDDNALGVLKQFLMYVEYGGGLPRAARLSPFAPNNEHTTALACDDHRLGLFRELLLGTGQVETYIALVGSPRAIGLREITASDVRILEAVAQPRLTTLRDVPLWDSAVMRALRDPKFDRVTELHITCTIPLLQQLFTAMRADEHGFWQRTPRHLSVDAELLYHAVIREAWATGLPLAALTSGSLTLQR